MKEYRRVPLDLLRRRLEVERYEAPAPLSEDPVEPARVRIKLRQHVGSPAQAVVKRGARVRVGDAVGRIAEGQTGADVHASIEGVVADVTPDCVEIAR